MGIDAAKECYSLANIGFGVFPTVVIMGVGPLWLCCVMKSKIMGAGKIVAIDKSNFRLAAAQKFGADFIVNINDLNEKERLEYVQSLTEGRGEILSLVVPAIRTHLVKD